MDTTTTTAKALPNDVAARYVDVIRRIAHMMARRLPPHVGVDDLIGAGFVGLAEAYRRSDPTRAETFPAYAEFRIRGAMIDELRARDPLSRDTRAFANRAARARRNVEGRTRQNARQSEIATELGMSIRTYQKQAGRAAVGTAVSIDSAREDDEPMDLPDHDTLADERVERMRAQQDVATALEALPPRLRKVVELYYGDELTLRDIGGVLGVTESRVCQLHADAIRHLRATTADANQGMS